MRGRGIENLPSFFPDLFPSETQMDRLVSRVSLVSATPVAQNCPCVCSRPLCCTGWGGWSPPSRGQVYTTSRTHLLPNKPGCLSSQHLPWLGSSEEMFEFSRQEASIYTRSPASRISSTAGLLGDFMTSAEKQSGASKIPPCIHASFVLGSPAISDKSFKCSSYSSSKI